MANPQKENGYTSISNELLEAIIGFGFVATHYKIVLFCLRYTYGFSRKEATLSESFIAKATNISKRYISQELNRLIAMNVIKVIKESTYNSARVLAINKNYEDWQSRTTAPQVNQSSTVEPQFNTTVEPQFNTTVEPQFHQDKQNIKQNINKGGKTKSTKKTKTFIAPTISEIQSYCQERNNGIDAEKFFDFYESKGWMIGKNKMTDWKAAVRTWERNNKSNGYNQPTLFTTTGEINNNKTMKPQSVKYQSRE